MAVTVFLEIDQGSDFIADIPLTDNEGAPLDITGFIVRSQFRKYPSSKIAYDFNAFPAFASEGIIRLELLGSVSSNIRPGRYVYDIEISNGLNKFRVVEGLLEVNAEVTKS